MTLNQKTSQPITSITTNGDAAHDQRARWGMATLAEHAASDGPFEAHISSLGDLDTVVTVIDANEEHLVFSHFEGGATFIRDWDFIDAFAV